MVKIKYQTDKQRWAVMQVTIFIGFKNIKVWWASRNTPQFSIQHYKSCLKKKTKPSLQDGRVSVLIRESVFLAVWASACTLTSDSSLETRKIVLLCASELQATCSERLRSQCASFPGQSSCSSTANSFASFPVVHKEGKWICFPTDLRKSHHSQGCKYMQSSRDHIQK